MRRILKFIHSRYSLAAFCIILEFVQVMTVFILLYKYFLPITVLGVVFHICVLLYIINKDEIPEFNFPWMILLLAFPGIGAFAFVLLSSTEKSRQEQREFEAARKKLTLQMSISMQFPNSGIGKIQP